MPELPEVQTIVSALLPRVRGQTIAAVTLGRPDFYHPDSRPFQSLIGRRVVKVSRRGKKIVFALDNANRFYIHLGMSGRLTLEPIESPRKNHTHFVLKIAGAELRLVDPRRFGGVFWLGADPLADSIGLGPEPLEMRPAQLAARLGRTTRAIKSALLDQKLVAGLGNIYVDESLFGAGIHPLSRADRLTREQINRLNRAIKQVLRRALRHRGSTLRDYRDADGNPGGFQSLHRVYDREGQPCANCGTPLKRLVLGGRSTHYCPRCQRR